MDQKYKRVLVQNLGGLLAVAAVFMEAGGLREKLANVSTAQAHMTISIQATREEIQQLRVDVALLKARESTGRGGAQ